MTWNVANDNKAILANMNNGLFRIESSQDNTGQDSVRISIFDTDGSLKLSFDDTALEYREWDGEIVTYFATMKQLLDDAFRSAKGEDKILMAILNELDELDIPF